MPFVRKMRKIRLSERRIATMNKSECVSNVLNEIGKKNIFSSRVFLVF